MAGNRFLKILFCLFIFHGFTVSSADGQELLALNRINGITLVNDLSYPYEFRINNIHVNSKEPAKMILDINGMPLIIYRIVTEQGVRYHCHGEITARRPLFSASGRFIKFIGITIHVNTADLKNEKEVAKWHDRLLKKMGEYVLGEFRISGWKIKEPGTDPYPDELYLSFVIDNK